MKGNASEVKVHYKGNNDDFIVIVDSVQAVKDWKKDSSVPLAQVVSSFKVFVTGGHGNQGILDGASKGSLESEFGTSNDDEVVKQILEKGSIVETGSAGRDGVKNVSQGGSVAH
ncbi:shwachman-bodian-diamond syndrome protein [Zymoseptoria brevis]|uniref:Shwachman-bodian-diamond syndrome protein n=1 Tax=Zymoseptoria brevis TaxID=1047168 RepID=A0A0F4GBA5_9PEZI|nr:shwachman-bodian-diamond syndrome protein [Zymoseptoria brevis]